jgi:hypothetical protein
MRMAVKKEEITVPGKSEGMSCDIHSWEASRRSGVEIPPNQAFIWFPLRSERVSSSDIRCRLSHTLSGSCVINLGTDPGKTLIDLQIIAGIRDGL